MKRLDGQAVADHILNGVREGVAELRQQGITPRLGVVLVGDNPASEIYVHKKTQAARSVGIVPDLYSLPADTSQSELEERVNLISAHALLVQLPLPAHLDQFAVFDAIDPNKDVDVLNPENVGLLVQGRPRYCPCTPNGIRELLLFYGITITGKHVVVINRSNIVGKPLAAMLIHQGATVTVCHDETPPELLAKMCRAADIIVVAVGIPGFLTAEMVSPHHVVVDVGINRLGKKVVGDVDPAVYNKVSYYTPVPGGIGPVTVAMLMFNTLEAARRHDAE